MVEKRLAQILAEHAPRRTNGKTAAAETQVTTKNILLAGFRVLDKKLGYRIQNPENLNETHIRELVRHWYYVQEKAPKTMQNQLSRFRVFAGWIKKPGLVKNIEYYLPEVPTEKLKVTVAATRSKSWAGNGIDTAEKFVEADAVDWRFGLMLRIELAMNMRRKEVVHCVPWKDDRGTHLFVSEGKGGKQRFIPVTTHEQRETLDYVKARMKKSERLGWLTTVGGEKATIEYSLRRYNKMMERIGITKAIAGVTGHGLRHQYTENLSMQAGFVPPVLGASVHIDEDDLTNKIIQISENLGHHRLSVYASYGGRLSQLRNGQKVTDAEMQLIIDTALLVLAEKDGLKGYPKERTEDVVTLVIRLSEKRLELSPAAAHALWSCHSRRYAFDWVRPTAEVVPAMLVAAKEIIKSYGATAKASNSVPPPDGIPNNPNCSGSGTLPSDRPAN